MKKPLTLSCCALIALLLAAAPVWSKGGGEPEPEPAPAKEQPAPELVKEEPKYKEAPMLAEMVAAGELPPVEERLPLEPKVIPPLESIGKYGGELHLLANAQNPLQDMQEPRHGANLYRVPRDGIGIEPDLAKGWEKSTEDNSFTVYLREGLKWSDGHPVTSEDFRFWLQDMIQNKTVTGLWGSFGITSVEVVDDLTVKLYKSGGIGFTDFQLADWFGSDMMCFWPSHYLKQFHADYNENAGKLAKDAGFETWNEYLQDRFAFWPIKNAELPRVDPWILKQFGTAQKMYERNPYFWRVDEAGNQLPYIDRLIVSIVNPEIYHLKVSGGEADIAYQQTDLENYSLYKSSAENEGCRVVLYPGAMSSVYTLGFGLNNPDPALRSILNDVRFHRALSVAIDRDEMNETLAYGLGVPGQASLLPSVSFYKEGWRETYAQYDPALSAKLLDEMGMDEKDRQGFRLRPDGEPFTLIIEYWHDRLTPALELIMEYFGDVGIKTVMKQEDSGFWSERLESGEMMISMHAQDWYPRSTERALLMNFGVWRDGAYHTGLWDTWWDAKADAVDETLAEGEERPANWWRIETSKDDELTGEEPPEWWLEQFELEQEFLRQEMGSPRYIEVGRQVFEYYMTELIKIGTFGEIPRPLVVKENLGNVPPPGYVAGYELNNQFMQAYADQFYWKD